MNKKISDITTGIYIVLVYSFIICGGFVYGWLNSMPIESLFELPCSIIFWTMILFWIIGVMDLVLEYRRKKQPHKEE